LLIFYTESRRQVALKNSSSSTEQATSCTPLPELITIGANLAQHIRTLATATY
jgi:hypothetical protein